MIHLLLALCFAPGPCDISTRGVLVWDLPPEGCEYTVACTPDGGCSPETFRYAVCDPKDPLNCRTVEPLYVVPGKWWDWAGEIEVYCCQPWGCSIPVVLIIGDYPGYCSGSSVEDFRICCVGGGCDG